jgi:ATP phosphoribosyltransferase
MIANKNLNPAHQDLLNQLLFRIKAVQAAKNNKYILLNCPKDSVDEVTKYLPGMKAPTVMPLATEGWCSIHSVINENDFWENIEKIRQAGAEGILVIPIEKMIL